MNANPPDYTIYSGSVELLKLHNVKLQDGTTPLFTDKDLKDLRDAAMNEMRKATRQETPVRHISAANG